MLHHAVHKAQVDALYSLDKLLLSVTVVGSRRIQIRERHSEACRRVVSILSCSDSYIKQYVNVNKCRIYILSPHCLILPHYPTDLRCDLPLEISCSALAELRNGLVSET